MTKWLVLMVGILVMTAVARAEDVKAPSFCERQLLAKPYAGPVLAQQICERFEMNTVGCAMDMIDMQIESDLFEAIEYCAAPIVRR